MPRKPGVGLTGVPQEVIKKPERRQIEALFVSCPMCGMSRKLDKTGNYAKLRHRLDRSKPPKGISHFGRFRLDDAYLIQVRDCSGSRGSGFPTIDGYTIARLKEIPEFEPLLTELKEVAQAILNKLSG